MIEVNASDEEAIEQLRTAYRGWPSVQSTSVDDIVRGARRRRGRQTGVTVMIGTVSAIATVTVAVVVAGQDGGTTDRPGAPPAAGQGTSESKGQTGEEHVTSSQLNAAADDMYARIDAGPYDSAYGYYMLQVDVQAGHIIVWRDQGGTPAIDTDLRQIADQAGIGLDLRALPDMNEWDPSARADQLSEVADQLTARINADPSYGYNLLKVEIPLNTIIVWHANPNPATDDALQAIADEAGIELELRHAQYSRQAIQAFGEQLESQNETWAQYGFTVNGASPRPAGAVVIVKGDLSAAQQELVRFPEVLGLQLDDFVNAVAESQSG